jgi:hypothetical protein
MTSRPDRVRVGWQYATPCPDPGPPPPRPTPPDAERVNPEWAAAQRREERHLNRPLRATVAAAALIGLVLLVLGMTGQLNGVVATLGVICCGLVAGVGGYAIWQGTRALRSRLAQERSRVSKLRATQESQLHASQEEHARRIRDWQARRVAFEHQKRWFPVYLPDGIRRVDIAGGTSAGWSALLTTVGAPRLAAGGEVTVLDLSQGADLAGLGRASGIEPLVWTLPEDLPRLDLSVGRDALAEVLSRAVGAGADDPAAARDLDHAILDRVIDVLGGTATVASVAAALRALAGDPADDVAAGLISAAQVTRLGTIGRGAALERVWVLEARLRKLAPAGTDPDPAGFKTSPLRVIALGQRAAAAEILGGYLALALTHNLAATTPPWRHTLFVLGADLLHGDIADRLCDACENTGTGLVLAYRTVPRRLGPGNAAVVFMRLDDAEDARAASERIGAWRPLLMSELTETGDAGSPDPQTQASRELTASAGELRNLPPSAMIISYAGEVVLADANPGIGDLSAAAELTLEELRATPVVTAAEPGPSARPNVGPPAQRLDWRRRRS